MKTVKVFTYGQSENGGRIPITVEFVDVELAKEMLVVLKKVNDLSSVYENLKAVGIPKASPAMRKLSAVLFDAKSIITKAEEV